MDGRPGFNRWLTDKVRKGRKAKKRFPLCVSSLLGDFGELL